MTKQQMVSRLLRIILNFSAMEYRRATLHNYKKMRTMLRDETRFLLTIFFCRKKRHTKKTLFVLFNYICIIKTGYFFLVHTDLYKNT
jgi:hypothetical protein